MSLKTDTDRAIKSHDPGSPGAEGRLIRDPLSFLAMSARQPAIKCLEDPKGERKMKSNQSIMENALNNYPELIPIMQHAHEPAMFLSIRRLAAEIRKSKVIYLEAFRDEKGPQTGPFM